MPERVQTDNSSAATRRLGVTEDADEEAAEAGRGYTAGYRQLLAHYGMRPSSTHTDNPNENGDIEAANGALKQSLKQHLLLRGSRDFESLEGYEAFLFQVMDKRNGLRQQELDQELAVMRPLMETPLATSSVYDVRVSSGSLIRVLKKSDSVPTSLIGGVVKVPVQEWTLSVYYAGKLVEVIPRLTGQKGHHINYRHLIDTLLRKPGGFRHYRYRDDLFPTLVFRHAWEQLNQWYSPRRADMAYLRILNLAAKTMESDVECALEILLEGTERWDDAQVKQRVQPEPPSVPTIRRGAVSLQLYDQLLGQGGDDVRR